MSEMAIVILSNTTFLPITEHISNLAVVPCLGISDKNLIVKGPETLASLKNHVIDFL